MEYWNKLSKPPASALKTITAGRIKGMTDVKPMWRIQAMTEVFGPCGIGWKYTVTKKWTEPGADGNVFAFVDVELFFKHDDKWSEAIPGNGGSMLVAKEKNGLFSSDEAYKMATTDALSSAMKMIGVAAEIYFGNWDGSKYKNEPIQKDLTVDQVRELENLIEDTESDLDAFLKYAKAKDVESIDPEKFQMLKSLLLAKVKK